MKPDTHTRGPAISFQPKRCRPPTTPPNATGSPGGMAADESDSEIIDSTTPSPSEWRDHANCKGHLKLFFAPKAERPQARARREAKAQRLCDGCTVVDPCRQFARDNREYGYWAGESEEDRHLLGFRVTAPIGARVRRAREAERESA